MKIITINSNEKRLLFKQNKSTEHSGGFQKLLVRLQGQYNSTTKQLKLYTSDLEKIGRYAYKYGIGGWENRLVGIFSRHFGKRLGWKGTIKRK